MSRERELLERALGLLDYSERASFTLESEIYACLDEPPRPAVRLSDDEINKILEEQDFMLGKVFRAIETAVLKANGLEVRE